jgi:uroporphyrinogen decarboxylase
MDKRERLEQVLAGERPDRTPVALWRHWPGDDQRTADFARSVLHFQQIFDWDFININPASTASAADYGVRTDWRGEISGDRTIIKAPVTRSLEWTELRPLDPMRGEQGKLLAAIQQIDEAVRLDGVPYIVTLYSPLTQAAMLGKGDLLLRNLRSHPDRLQTGLNVITESVLRFIEALKRTGVAGIFYVMRHACLSLMSETEYQQLGVPYDRKILESLPPKWWLNVVSLQNNAPMFSLAAGYPVQALHWDIAGIKPDVDKARSLYKGTLCGGLSADEHLLLGTPAAIRQAATDLLKATGDRHFILTAGGPVPVSAPLSNLHAARVVVDKAGGN